MSEPVLKVEQLTKIFKSGGAQGGAVGGRASCKL